METPDNLHEFEVPQNAPDNNMTLSVVGTILGLCSPCCIGLIVGIVAIVMSSQVSSKFTAGDYAGAQTSAKNAKTLAYIAIGLGVLGLIINIVSIFMLGGLEAYRETIESALEAYGQ